MEQWAGSVVLPCLMSPDLLRSGNDSSVKWTREDLSPDLVHVLNQNSDQNPGNRGRTSMTEQALETGDFSLTLTDPISADSGKYTCTLYLSNVQKHQTEVDLVVRGQSCSLTSVL